MWPENWCSWEVFRSLATQWRVRDTFFGFSYAGLDYPAVKIVMWAYTVKKKDRRQVFDDVRVMERAALGVLNKAVQ